MPFFPGGMALVDKNIVLRKLSELELYGKQIHEFAEMTVEGFNDDWKTQRIIERTLQRGRPGVG